MLVKQRLRINTAVSIVAAATILLVLFISMQRIIKAVETADIAGRILTSSFERATLRNDFLQRGSERARGQWFVKHEEVKRLSNLAADKFRDPEDKKIIAEMIANQDFVGRIFSDIVENRLKAKDPVHLSISARETEARLISQLNMRNYDLVSMARQLQDSSREYLFSALRLAGWGIAFVLVMVMAAVTINSWKTGQKITERIRLLHSGTSTVGGGNLDSRIEIRGDDEFTELSEAFNRMTVRLQWSYRDLENEVKERRRTEAELRESEKRYRTIFETMNEGFSLDEIICDDQGKPYDLRYLAVNPAFERQTGVKAADVVGHTTLELFPKRSPSGSSVMGKWP